MRDEIIDCHLFGVPGVDFAVDDIFVVGPHHAPLIIILNVRSLELNWNYLSSRLVILNFPRNDRFVTKPFRMLLVIDQ